MAATRPVCALMLAVAIAVAGCAQQSGGRDGPTAGEAAGGVAGGVLGGLLGAQIGGGRGQLIATGTGAVLGAMLGARIGRELTESDHRQMADTTQSALENNATGEPATWSNPDTQHEGSVTPTADVTHDGRHCREFRQTVVIEGQQEEAVGTACRREDGNWELVS